MTSPSDNNPQSSFFSPKELANRWQVSRSSVSRIAKRAGFNIFYPGDGKNSSVRHPREEVIAYEQSRQITLTQ